jgi:hypothetical protein
MPRRLEDIRTPLPPLDGRTYVARELKRFRGGLLKQLGPNLTPLQAAQLELALGLKRQLLEWDCAYGSQGRDPSLHDTRTTLGWIGALSRILEKLEPPPPPPESKPRRKPSLQDFVDKPADSMQRLSGNGHGRHL